MNTCPSCGKMTGVNHNILQGCTCQWSMQSIKEGKYFAISKPWVDLTDADIAQTMQGSVEGSNMLPYQFARAIEAKLKQKNGYAEEKNT